MNKHIYSDEKHEVLAFEDLSGLQQAAAGLLVEIASRATARRCRFLCALSGGGTPAGLYELLAQPPYRDEIAWRQTHWFWADERLVAPGDPGSNYRQAHELFLGRVPVPAGQVWRARGELPAEAARRDYAQKLKQAAAGPNWPRFDLSLLGMGADGHTASLFPGAISPQERAQTVVAVQADYQGRPAARLSLTPAVFNTSRKIIFMLAGRAKAQALAAVIRGRRDPERWPAQRIQPAEGKITWLVDRAAAADLLQVD